MYYILQQWNIQSLFTNFGDWYSFSISSPNQNISMLSVYNAHSVWHNKQSGFNRNWWMTYHSESSIQLGFFSIQIKNFFNCLPLLYNFIRFAKFLGEKNPVFWCFGQGVDVFLRHDCFWLQQEMIWFKEVIEILLNINRYQVLFYMITILLKNSKFTEWHQPNIFFNLHNGINLKYL